MGNIRSIIPIVEGDGDEAAVPSLLRRILDDAFGRTDILAFNPINAKGKPRLLKNIERLVALAEQKRCNGILIVLDADDECPFDQATIMADKIRSFYVQVPIAIVYANSEYETWFICSLFATSGESIREILEIPQAISSPQNAESIGSAKGWLDHNMPQDQKYKETTHQKQLTPYIDFNVTLAKSRSFRRLFHAIEELVKAIDHGQDTVSPAV